ncbi:MAG: hybrid sensor histidine kinase/response regulator [Calditrichaeota bacterium]|nr:MAG: hybrid sensor histidine kinase/response regulator [Calditrichota bacterium]
MKKKILLIDDDQDIHVHIRIILEKAGYQFVSAYDGKEGLAKIQSEKPDLVILDYLMPEMNGFDAYREIMTNPAYQAFRQIPVIMLTALDQSPKDVRDMLVSGIHAYLEKPFGHRELLNVIENTFVTNEIRIRNTELRKAIENSKNFLESLVESCPVIIMTTDSEGVITFASKATEEILGFRTQEVIGKPLHTFLNVKKSHITELLQQMESKPSSVTDELYLNSTFGKLVPMAFTYSNLKDQFDNILGLLIVGQNLSDRKRLEHELLEKERLKAITESFATINHQLNNPLTPILGNLQLMQKEKDQMCEGHIKRLEIIEENVRKISQIIQKFNKVTKVSTEKYYGDQNMVQL